MRTLSLGNLVGKDSGRIEIKDDVTRGIWV
jgi:hypothetical protein